MKVMRSNIIHHPSKIFPHPSNIIHIFLFIQKKVVPLHPLLSPFPLWRRDVEHSESYKLLDISVVAPILMLPISELDALRTHAGCPLALLYTIRR